MSKSLEKFIFEETITDKEQQYRDVWAGLGLKLSKTGLVTSLVPQTSLNPDAFQKGFLAHF